jgi:hypothetical protein
MKVLSGLLLAVGLYGAVDRDMQRAIAWERQKERAAARQARLEKTRPSVTYNNTANRDVEEPKGREVKDPGPNNINKEGKEVKK